MTPTFTTDYSVAVASGTLAIIEHWGELLCKAKIRCEVRWSCDDASSGNRRHAELWVEKGSVDAARSIIRASEPQGSLLW